MIDSLLKTLGILKRMPKSLDRDTAIQALIEAIADAKQIAYLLR